MLECPHLRRLYPARRSGQSNLAARVDFGFFFFLFFLVFHLNCKPVDRHRTTLRERQTGRCSRQAAACAQGIRPDIPVGCVRRGIEVFSITVCSGVQDTSAPHSMNWSIRSQFPGEFPKFAMLNINLVIGIVTVSARQLPGHLLPILSPFSCGASFVETVGRSPTTYKRPVEELHARHDSLSAPTGTGLLGVGHSRCSITHVRPTGPRLPPSTGDPLVFPPFKGD